MKFIQQQAMECFSVNSGGANHVPPLRCRSPRRPVRGLGLSRSSGGALHEHDGHHFILDLARHLFIRQKPRFILFIMPSLGPTPRTRSAPAPRQDKTVHIPPFLWRLWLELELELLSAVWGVGCG